MNPLKSTKNGNKKIFISNIPCHITMNDFEEIIKSESIPIFIID